MTLEVYELDTTKYANLYQQIRIGTHDIWLAGFRPHILRYGTPAGSLQMTVRDANGGLIATTDTVAISSIKNSDESVQSTYWHGYLRFQTTAQLKASTIYRIQLEGVSGYAFSETAYIGWNNDFDLRKVLVDYSPHDGVSSPLDLEIWENIEVWRRVG